MKSEFWLFQQFNAILLDAEQIASVLGVNAKTIQNGASAGTFPKQREPGLWHIEDIAAYCDRESIKPSVHHAIAGADEDARAIVAKAKRHVMRRRGSFLYLLLDGDAVVYVGKTNSLITRLHTHAREGVKVFDGFALVDCPVADQGKMEMTLIRTLRPKYNKQGLRS